MDGQAGDQAHISLHQRRLAIDGRFATLAPMAIVLTFLLGIANFAVHKAVLESRHPLMREMPRFVRMLGGKASLAAEFVLLAGALLLTANGYPGWGLAYLGYSIVNGLSGWLILSRRI
jgi:hypothetical protein